MREIKGETKTTQDMKGDRMMKKFTMILAATGLALAACSGDTEPETSTDEDAESAAEVMTDTEETESEEESAGAGDPVEVTIPSSFFEGGDPEQIAAEAESEDMGEATVNDDGSITYIMSSDQHEAMMQELGSAMDNTVNNITDSGEYPSIQAVEASRNYNLFTVLVDREAYESSFDGFATMTLGLTGSLYQLFDGADADNYEVNINIEDIDTGEVFDTIIYPDALDEIGEE